MELNAVARLAAGAVMPSSLSGRHPGVDRQDPPIRCVSSQSAKSDAVRPEQVRSAQPSADRGVSY
jgi:hypothetical protein